MGDPRGDAERAAAAGLQALAGATDHAIVLRAGHVDRRDPVAFLAELAPPSERERVVVLLFEGHNAVDRGHCGRTTGIRGRQTEVMEQGQWRVRVRGRHTVAEQLPRVGGTS